MQVKTSTNPIQSHVSVVEQRIQKGSYSFLVYSLFQLTFNDLEGFSGASLKQSSPTSLQQGLLWHEPFNEEALSFSYLLYFFPTA